MRDNSDGRLSLLLVLPGVREEPRAVNDDEWEDLRRALIRRARTRYGADAAEDIVQETIADFLVKPRIVAEGKLLNYLRRAVKNQAVERWRRTRHEVSAEGWRLMASLPDPVDRIGAADELARVEEMMGTAGMEVLSKDERERPLWIYDGELIWP